ncbi:MAG: hypothetical protein ACPGO3_10955 [Magnetospiraceae bacterium]
MTQFPRRRVGYFSFPASPFRFKLSQASRLTSKIPEKSGYLPQMGDERTGVRGYSQITMVPESAQDFLDDGLIYASRRLSKGES